MSSHLFLAGYAIFLPETPPRMRGKEVNLKDVWGLDAIGLFSDRSFLVFAVGSMLLTIPHSILLQLRKFIFNEVGILNPAGSMTLGQMSK